MRIIRKLGIGVLLIIMLVMFYSIIFGKDIFSTVNNYFDSLTEAETTKNDTVSINKNTENSVGILVKENQAFEIQLGDARVEGQSGCITKDTEIRIIGLNNKELVILPEDLINVTGEYAGYRMLPAHSHFLKNLTITIPYDILKIPEGFSQDEIRSFYYDDSLNLWKEIEFKGIDTIKRTIISEVNHFTDFINAIIKTPEIPESESYIPTSIKEMQAENPLSSFNFIAPPKANNSGSANIEFPLQIPAGRQGMQPNLSIDYNSSRDVGLFGLGWGLQIPEITIETRWGVPQYDSNLESETYLLNGEQLLRKNGTTIEALTHREAWKPRDVSGVTEYYQRVEGSFNKIIRHGTSTSTYWWEIIDKNGTKYYYGKKLGEDTVDNNSILKTMDNNIGKWKLSEIRDLNDNFVKYYYTKNYNGYFLSEIVPQRITYTGNDTTEGKYSINFHVNNISDSSYYTRSNARLGLLEGNHSIVKEIIIKYDTAIIKQYRFSYEEGAFKKLLLNKILELQPSEFGNIETVLSSVNNPNTIVLQEFEYNNLPSSIFSTESIIQETETLYPSAPLSAINNMIKKLSSNSDISWGTGIASTVGFGVGPAFIKLLTAGASFNFTQNFSNGERSFIDLNGDGLPDRITRVLQQGDRKVFYEELSLSDSNTYEFLPPEELDIEKFSRVVSNSINFGSEAHCGLTVSGDLGESWNKTKVYFTDINADGLPDLVDNGYVYYNQLDNDGIPTFSVVVPDSVQTQTFAETICIDAGMGSDAGTSGNANPINANEIDSEILYEEGRIIETRHCVSKTEYLERFPGNWNNFYDSIRENFVYEIKDFGFCWYTYDTIPPEKEIYPPHDLVKIFVAPYDGAINISGNAIMTANLMDKRDESDSLKISIQVGNTIVFQEKLDSSHTLASINLNMDITKDTPIYFRLESMDKKRYDKVFWQPTISYSEINNTVISTDSLNLLDPNGLYLYKFNSSSDFLVNPKLDYEMPFNGEINVKSNRIINNYLSDTVYFTIKKNNSVVYYSSDRDVVSDSINIQNIHVNTADKILFEVFCKSNINWQSIQWNPILYYDSIYPQTIDSININFAAYDNNFTPPKPNVKFDILPNLTTYPKPISPSKIFIPPYNLNVDSSIVDTIRIQRFPSNAAVSGYLSFKGSDNSVQNVYISIDSNYISGNEISLSNSLIFYDTISYFIDFYIPDTSQLNLMKINLSHTSIPFGGYQKIGLHCRQNKSDLRFGDMYKNWGQFNYKNTSGNYTDIIYEDSLNLSQGLQNTLNYVENLIASANPPNDSATLDTANNIMMNWFNTHPYEQEKFLPMTADYKYNQWVGYGNISYVNADTLSNTIPVVLGNVPDTDYSGEIPIGQIEEVDEEPENLPEGAIKQAPLLKSNSFTLSGNSSVFGVIGGGISSTITNTKTAFQDMNGDRYPDEISEDEIKYSSPQGGTSDFIKSHIVNDYGAEKRKTIGHSYSFGAATTTSAQIKSFQAGKKYKSQGVSGSASLGGTNNNTLSELFFLDFNGDGLADKVTNEGDILYNLGYTFLYPRTIPDFVKQDSSQVSSVGGGAVNICGTSISAGINITNSDNYTKRDYLDINGDGLPDKIIGSINGLNVSFSTGENFSNSILINGINNIFKTKGGNVSTNVAVTFGWGTWVTIDLNPKIFMSWGANGVEEMFSDINADGLPDYVYEDNGDIKVRLNQLGKTNLLKTVKNLAGGEFSIDYALSKHDAFNSPTRSMVMDSLTVFDGFVGDGEDYQYFAFDYDSCRYNRFDREQLGFNTVNTKFLDKYKNIYKIYTEKYHNDKIITKNLKYYDCILDSDSNKYVENIYKYSILNINTGDVIDSTCACGAVGYPNLTEKLTNYYEAANTPQITTRTRYEYTSFGNVEKVYEDGDITTNDDNFTKEYLYFDVPSKYIVGTASNELVKDYNNNILRESSCVIDTLNGNLTEIYLHNGDSVSNFSYSFDDYGNITQMELAPNNNNQRMTYNFIFDNQVHTYPVTISDILGYASCKTWDYKYGNLLTNTNMNGNTTKFEYDWRGRITYIKSPADIPFSYHSIRYDYSAANSNDSILWSRVSYVDRGNPGNLINAVAFSDGLGRIVQTKKDSEIFNQTSNSSVEIRVVSGKRILDEFGRTIKEYNPFVENISLADSVINQYTAVGEDTLNSKITYDILNRNLEIVYPDNTGTTKSYSISSGQFVETTTDAMNNSVIKRSDARNLLAQITTNLGNTNFVYNAVGELLHSTDPENNTTDFNYDNFGRIVSRTSPDAGTHSFTYDKAGNIVQENNNGKITNYIYHYIQNTEIQFPANTENNIKFTWGSNTAINNRVGRIYLIEDINGWTQYDYDVFGNVATKQKKVVLPNEDASYNFYISYSFDYFGRVKTVTHQDSEVITYNYDLGGNLRSVKGVKTNQSTGTSENYNYIDSIFYNKFGKRTLVYYGNNCSNAYSYDNMQRLKTLKTRAKINTNNEENLQSLFYNYDAVGNILSISNVAELVPMNPLTYDYFDNYSYDDAYRLVSAQMSRTNNNQVKTNNASYQYSNNGKILNMQNNGTTVIGGLSLVSNSSQSYNYQNNNNKLQRTTLTILGALSNSFTDYLYDACGNMTVAETKKIISLVPTTVNKRRLYWNERNQMQAVQDTNYSSFYFYDYGGERTWKISGAKLSTTRNGVTTKYNIFNNSTLYVFPELTVNSQSYIKHIFAESERICSKIGNGRPSGNPINNVPINVSSTNISTKKTAQKKLMRKVYTNLCIPTSQQRCAIGNNCNVMSTNILKPAIDSISLYGGVENTRYFYHGDHLGSSSWITDKDGNALQYISYLPYGQLFMDLKTTSYDASYKFIGKERDVETGFVITDHRSYDPNLGMFLSVDPLAHLRFWITPYNYGQNSPINRSDPSGLLDGDYHNKKGKYLGTDGINDSKIHIIYDKKSINTIAKNNRIGGTTQTSDVKVAVSTNKATLKEVVGVYNRTVKNGGFCEESSVVSPDGKNVLKGERGTDVRLGKASADLPYMEGNDNTSIHSHPLEEYERDGVPYYASPLYPSTIEDGPKNDVTTFKNYQLNIIVGNSHQYDDDNKNANAVFYDRNTKNIGSMTIRSLNKIINR